MRVSSTLGPIASAWLLAPDCERVVAAYRRDLGFVAEPLPGLDAVTAVELGAEAGARHCRLGPPGCAPWLHVVEAPGVSRALPWRQPGWLALEVLVADPTAIVAGLGPDWQVLGAPAALELSPSIRATQVLGPCDELLYFTAIDAPVPPFDLPTTREKVAHPFVAVVATADREASRAAWQALADGEASSFDTRVGVLNRAFGRPPEQRWPLAVLPLRGQALIEIDGIEAHGFAAGDAGPRAGLTLIEIESGGPCGLWRGPSGERVRLVPAGV